MDLKNKVALVTGGSSGIGQAICIALAQEGCKVIFTYNSNEEGANETLKKVGENGQKFKVDVRNETDINNVFKFIKNKYENIDILVNSAGIEVPGDDKLDISVWRETFEVDLFSVVLITKYAADLISEGGRILNISSGYGEENSGSVWCFAYSAAKAGLNSFSRTLAKKLAPKINVNALSPGYVDTPMWKVTTDDQKKELGKDQLIGRFIKSEEIADMALATIKNDAMTGEVVVLDGGLSLKTV